MRINRRKTQINKILSGLIAFLFLFQDVVGHAAIDLSVQSQTDFKQLYVPQDIGIVKESQIRPSSDVIVNVKDIHDNFGAQQSIVQILENLVVNYNVRTIGMEGVEGFVDTSLLAALPDDDLRLKTANHMMQEGKLSAGEFFSAVTGGKIAVYGMDDEKLYEKNLEAFKQNLKNKTKNYAAVDRLRSTLARFEEAVYSSDLRNLNENGVLNRNGNLKFSDRWKEISSMADRLGVAYRDYPNIQNLLKVMEMETRIDFDRTNSERETLMDALSKVLERDKLEKLVLESVAYKMGKVSQGSFSSFVLEAARAASMDTSTYSNLAKYAEYMMAYESVDIDALKDEVGDLEDKLREKVFRNQKERELYALTKQCDILKDLFEVKLSSASLAYFKKNGHEFKAEAFKKFLTEESVRLKVPQDPLLDVDAIFANIADAMQFYELAEERNHMILANTIRKMKADGQTVACLVTGGFHTRGITQLLKENQTSYVVILPRFSKKSTRPYLTIITNNESSYKKFAESEYALQAQHEITAHFFAQVAFREAVKNIYDNDWERNAGVQKEVTRMKALYLNSFNALKRSYKDQGLIKETSPFPSTDNPETKIEANDRDQIVPDAQAIRNHLLPLAKLVIESMQLAYAEKRVFVLFTASNGKKYLYILNWDKDNQTARVEKNVAGQDADAQFKNAEAVVGAFENDLGSTDKLESLARELAGLPAEEVERIARRKNVSETTVQKLLTELKTQTDQEAQEAKVAKKVSRRREAIAAKEARDAEKKLRQLERLRLKQVSRNLKQEERAAQAKKEAEIAKQKEAQEQAEAAQREKAQRRAEAVKQKQEKQQAETTRITQETEKREALARLASLVDLIKPSSDSKPLVSRLMRLFRTDGKQALFAAGSFGASLIQQDTATINAFSDFMQKLFERAANDPAFLKTAIQLTGILAELDQKNRIDLFNRLAGFRVNRLSRLTADQVDKQIIQPVLQAYGAQIETTKQYEAASINMARLAKTWNVSASWSQFKALADGAHLRGKISHADLIVMCADIAVLGQDRSTEFLNAVAGQTAEFADAKKLLSAFQELGQSEQRFARATTNLTQAETRLAQMQESEAKQRSLAVGNNRQLLDALSESGMAQQRDTVQALQEEKARLENDVTQVRARIDQLKGVEESEEQAQAKPVILPFAPAPKSGQKSEIVRSDKAQTATPSAPSRSAYQTFLDQHASVATTKELNEKFAQIADQDAARITQIQALVAALGNKEAFNAFATDLNSAKEWSFEDLTRLLSAHAAITEAAVSLKELEDKKAKLTDADELEAINRLIQATKTRDALGWNDLRTLRTLVAHPKLRSFLERLEQRDVPTGLAGEFWTTFKDLQDGSAEQDFFIARAAGLSADFLKMRGLKTFDAGVRQVLFQDLKDFRAGQVEEMKKAVEKEAREIEAREKNIREVVTILTNAGLDQGAALSLLKKFPDPKLDFKSFKRLGKRLKVLETLAPQVLVEILNAASGWASIDLSDFNELIVSAIRGIAAEKVMANPTRYLNPSRVMEQYLERALNAEPDQRESFGQARDAEAASLVANATEARDRALKRILFLLKVKMPIAVRHAQARALIEDLEVENSGELINNVAEFLDRLDAIKEDKEAFIKQAQGFLESEGSIGIVRLMGQIRDKINTEEAAEKIYEKAKKEFEDRTGNNKAWRTFRRSVIGFGKGDASHRERMTRLFSRLSSLDAVSLDDVVKKAKSIWADNVMDLADLEQLVERAAEIGILRGEAAIFKAQVESAKTVGPEQGYEDAPSRAIRAQAPRDLARAQAKLKSAQEALENSILVQKIKRAPEAKIVLAFADLLERLNLREEKKLWLATFAKLKDQSFRTSTAARAENVLANQNTLDLRILAATAVNVARSAKQEIQNYKESEKNLKKELKTKAPGVRDNLPGAIRSEVKAGELSRREAADLSDRISKLESYLLKAFLKDLHEDFSMDELRFLLRLYEDLQRDTELVTALRALKRNDELLKRYTGFGLTDSSSAILDLKAGFEAAENTRKEKMKDVEAQIARFKSYRDAAIKDNLEDIFHPLALAFSDNAEDQLDFWGRLLEAWSKLDPDKKNQPKRDLESLGSKLNQERSLEARRVLVSAALQRMVLDSEINALFQTTLDQLDAETKNKRISLAQRQQIVARLNEIKPKRQTAPSKDGKETAEELADRYYQELEVFVTALKSSNSFGQEARDFFLEEMSIEASINLYQFSRLVRHIRVIQDGPKLIAEKNNQINEEARLLGPKTLGMDAEDMVWGGPVTQSASLAEVARLQKKLLNAAKAIEAIQAEREQGQNVLKLQELKTRIQTFGDLASFEAESQGQILSFTDRVRLNGNVLKARNGLLQVQARSKHIALPVPRETQSPETAFFSDDAIGTKLLPVVNGNILVTTDLLTENVSTTEIAQSITDLGLAKDPGAAEMLATWFQDEARNLSSSQTIDDETVLATVRIVRSSTEPAYFSDGIIHLDLDSIEAILSDLTAKEHPSVLNDFMNYVFHHEQGHHELNGLDLPGDTEEERREIEEREVLKKDAAYYQSKSDTYRRNVRIALELLTKAGYDVSALLAYLEALEQLRRASESQRKKEEEAGRRTNAPPAGLEDRLNEVQNSKLKFHLTRFLELQENLDEDQAQAYFDEHLVSLLEELGNFKPTNHVGADNAIKDAYSIYTTRGPNSTTVARLRRRLADPKKGQKFLANLTEAYADLSRLSRFRLQVLPGEFFSRADIRAALVGEGQTVGVVQQRALELLANSENLETARNFFSQNVRSQTMVVAGEMLLTEAVEEALIAVDRKQSILSLLETLGKEDAIVQALESAKAKGKIFTLTIGKVPYRFHEKVFNEAYAVAGQIAKVSQSIAQETEAITKAETQIKQYEKAKNQAKKDKKFKVMAHYQILIRDKEMDKDRNEINRFALTVRLQELRARVGVKLDAKAQRENEKERDKLRKKYSAKTLADALSQGYEAEADRLNFDTKALLKARELDDTADDFESKLQDLLSEEWEILDAQQSESEKKKERATFSTERFGKLAEDNDFSLFKQWLSLLGVESSQRVSRLFQAVADGHLKIATVARWFNELSQDKAEYDRLTTLWLIDEVSRTPQKEDQVKARHALRRSLEAGVGKSISLTGLLKLAKSNEEKEAAKKAKGKDQESKKDEAKTESAEEAETLKEDADTELQRFKTGVSSSSMPYLQDLTELIRSGQQEITRIFDKPRVLIAMSGIDGGIDSNGNLKSNAEILKWAVDGGLIKNEDVLFNAIVKLIGTSEEAKYRSEIEDYLRDKDIAPQIETVKEMIRTLIQQPVGSETFLNVWQREKAGYLAKVDQNEKAFKEAFNEDWEKYAGTEDAVKILAKMYQERFQDSIHPKTGKLAEDKIVDFIAFITEALKWTAKWKGGLKADQRIMLGLFMGWQSAGLLAGGGKTVVYPMYHLLARAVVGNDYHGRIVAESADGVRGFTIRAIGKDTKNTLRDYFDIFGMTLENGSELFDRHDMDTLVKKLQDPNSLVVIDKTSAAHVNNNSEEGPKLRRALNGIMVTTVDEVHLFSMDRDAALLSKGTREADLDDVENVKRIIDEIYDRNRGRFKSFIEDPNSPTDDPAQLGQIELRTEKDFREAHKKYRDTEEGNKKMVIFQRGEEVNVSQRLEEYLRKRTGAVSNKIIASTIRGLLKLNERGKAGGWDVTKTKEGDELKEVIAPIGHDGAIKATSVISDIHYQAVLALSAKGWDVKEARKLVRVSDSSTQVAITDALQNDTGTRVMGASGTVQELEPLIQATMDSEVVNINASKSQLNMFTALDNREDVYREIENTVRGNRDGIARGALVAAYDVKMIGEIRDYFRARNIRVRVMGSTSDKDIADIVEKANTLSADRLGTVTIFNERGMTGRDYKNGDREITVKDENGKDIKKTIKVGLDLFHMEMGDEKTAALLFDQTTARNRRDIADGRRFYLWDAKAQNLVSDRLNDLFDHENRELKDEIIKKFNDPKDNPENPKSPVKKILKTLREDPGAVSEEDSAFLFMFRKLQDDTAGRIGNFEDYRGELIEAVLSERILGLAEVRDVDSADQTLGSQRAVSIRNQLSQNKDTQLLSSDQTLWIQSLLGQSLDALRKDQDLVDRAKARYRNGLLLLNQKYLTIKDINEAARFMVQDTSYTRFVVEPLKEALRVVRKDKQPKDPASEIEIILQTNLESALRRESDYVQLLLGSTAREKGFEYTQGVLLSAILQAEETFKSLLASEKQKNAIESLMGATAKLESLATARENILKKNWDNELNDREPLRSFAQAKREANGDYAKLVEYTYRASQALAKKKMISKMGRQSHITRITRLNDESNKAEMQVKAFSESNQDDLEDDETKAETKLRKKNEPTQGDLRAKIAITAFTDGFQVMVAKNRKMMRIMRPGAVGIAKLVGNQIQIKTKDESGKQSVSFIDEPQMVLEAKRLKQLGYGAVFKVEIQKGEGENEGGLNLSFTHLSSILKSSHTFADMVNMGDVNAHVLHTIISFGGPGDNPGPNPPNVYPSTLAAMASQLDLSDDELVKRITRGLEANHSLQNARMRLTDMIQDGKKRKAFFTENKAFIKKLPNKEMRNAWRRIQKGTLSPSKGQMRTLALSYLSWTLAPSDFAEVRTVSNYENLSKDYKRLMEQVLKDVRSIDDPQFYGFFEQHFMRLYFPIREQLANAHAADPEVAAAIKANPEKAEIEKKYDDLLKKAMDSQSGSKQERSQLILQLNQRKESELKNFESRIADEMLNSMDSEKLRGLLQKINLKEEILNSLRNGNPREQFFGKLLKRLQQDAQLDLEFEFRKQFPSDLLARVEAWREFQSLALMLGLNSEPLARVNLSMASSKDYDVHLRRDLILDANEIAKLSKNKTLEAEIKTAFVRQLEASAENAKELELRRIIRQLENTRDESGRVISSRISEFKDAAREMAVAADPATRQFLDDVMIASGFNPPAGWDQVNANTTLGTLAGLMGISYDQLYSILKSHFGEKPFIKDMRLQTALERAQEENPSVTFSDLVEFLTDTVRVRKGLAIAAQLEEGPSKRMIAQGDALAVEFQKIQSLLAKYDVYEDGAERLSNAARLIGSKGFLLRDGRERFGFDARVLASNPEQIQIYFTHILLEWSEREQYFDNSNHDDTLMLVAGRVADGELGSLAAQILKNRFSATSLERHKDFGNIASNLKTVVRRDNESRPVAIDVEGGLDISEGKIFIHTYEVVKDEDRDLEDTRFGKLGRTVTTRVLSRIDVAAEDRGNNVSQNNGDHTISHFRSKTGKWNDTEIRGVLNGEKEAMLQLMQEDLERLKRNDPADPTRLIKITKSGGVDFINLKDAEKYKDSKEVLRMIGYKARVTGYRDANPQHRALLMANLSKVLDFEMEETRMKMDLFNKDLVQKNQDGRKLTEPEFQSFIDDWMHDLDEHEVQHELDQVVGRSAYWHKKFKGEDGIRHREIDAHLKSIAEGRNPFSVLTQVTTYISRGSSGIGYAEAGSEILRYLARHLSAGEQTRVKNAVKDVLLVVSPKDYSEDLFSTREKTMTAFTNPRAVVAMGRALAQVSRDDLMKAAKDGMDEFLDEKGDGDVEINQAPQSAELGDVARSIMEGEGMDEEAFRQSLLADPEFKKKISEKIPEVEAIFRKEFAYAREHGFGAAVEYIEANKIKLKIEKYAYRVLKDGYEYVGAQIRGELHTLSEMLKRSPDEKRLMDYAAAKGWLPKNYLELENEANENKMKAVDRIRGYLQRSGIPESMVNTILSDLSRAFLSKSAYREVPFYTEGKTVDKGSTAAYSFDSFELVVIATEEDPTKNTTADFRHVLNHEIQHFNIDIANEKIREAIVELISLLNNHWRGETSDQYQDVLRRLGAQEGEYRKFMDFAKLHFKDFSYDALIYAQMTGDLSVLGLYSLEGAVATMDAERQKNPKMKFVTNFDFTTKTPKTLRLRGAVALETLKALTDEETQSLAGVVFSLVKGKRSVVLKHVHGKAVDPGEKKRQKDEPIKPEEFAEAQKPIKNLAVPPPPKDEEDKAKIPSWVRRSVVVRFGQRFLSVTPEGDGDPNDSHQIGQVSARGLSPEKQAQLDTLGGPRESGEKWYLLSAVKRGAVSERPIAVAKIRKDGSGRFLPQIAVQPIADTNGNALSERQIKNLMTHPLSDGRFSKYLSDPLGRAEAILDQTTPLLFGELRDWAQSRRYNGAELNARYERRSQEIADEVADRRGFGRIQVIFPAKGAELRGNQTNPVALNIAGPQGATHGLITDPQPVGQDAAGRQINGPYKFDGPLGAIVEAPDEKGQNRRWAVVTDNTLQVILGNPDSEDKAMVYLTEAAVHTQENAIRKTGHLLGGDKALSALAKRSNISILYEGQFQNHKEQRVLLPDQKYPDTTEGRRQQNAQVLKAMHSGVDEKGNEEPRDTLIKEGESFSIEPFLVSGKDSSTSQRIVYWTGEAENPVYVTEVEVDLSDRRNLRHKVTGEKVHQWQTLSSAGRKAYTIEKTYRAVKDDKGKLEFLDTTALDLGRVEVSIISPEAPASALLAFPTQSKPLGSVAARLALSTQSGSNRLAQSASSSLVLAAIVLDNTDPTSQELWLKLQSQISGARLVAVSDRDQARQLLETDRTSTSQAIIDIRPDAEGTDRFQAISGAIQAVIEEDARRRALSVEAINPEFTGKSRAEIAELLAQMPEDELEATALAALQALQDALFKPANWQSLFEEGGERDGTAEIKLNGPLAAYRPIAYEYANRFAGLIDELSQSSKQLQPHVKAIRASKILLPDGQIDPAFIQATSVLEPILKGNLYLYSYDAGESATLRARLDAAGMNWLEVKQVAETDRSQLLEALKRQINVPEGTLFTLSLEEAEFKDLDPAAIRPNIQDRYVVTPEGVGALWELGLAILAQMKKESLIVVKGKDEKFFNEVLQKYPWLLPVTPKKLFEEIRAAINSLRQSEIAA